MNNFSLDREFLAGYENRTPPFGYNGLGELVYSRTYSRIKSDGEHEKWHETLARVVNATYNIQLKHINELNLSTSTWDDFNCDENLRSFDYDKAQASAQEMYDRMYNMKFLPPGRGLWAMGSPMTEERGIYASLYNCGFVSTKDMDKDPVKPFTFLMDMSMLGVGVGFDVEGYKLNLPIQVPLNLGKCFSFSTNLEIEDSREGWVQALSYVLSSYLIPQRLKLKLDYSKIRPSGLPIKGFGGISSGPEPLKKLLDDITKLFEEHKEPKILTITDIVDIQNMIGRCVIAGNVRRTAEIAFGPANDEYLDLKNHKVNPIRNGNDGWSWTSNNSVFADTTTNYENIAKRIQLNGEPGLCWLKNMRAYSRMDGNADHYDYRVGGGNPCLEQSLESFELCCLVETFPHHHYDLKDYLKTLKYAYLYAKTVALCETHWEETNEIMRRNYRIGCSISGVAQFVAARNIDTLRIWLQRGYEAIQEHDEIYSKWFKVNESIKTTSVKPSGTVSLLAGATPGMHWPQAKYYIRRVRLASESPLIKGLKEAGYYTEEDVRDNKTMIVEFPIKTDDGIPIISEVSMWEQLSMAAFLQRYWADNQVSCTVTFDPLTEGPQIASALKYFQYQLKGVSFLPRLEHGSYPQMPYETISAEQYRDKMTKINPDMKLPTRDISDYAADRFCDGDTCQGA